MKASVSRRWTFDLVPCNISWCVYKRCWLCVIEYDFFWKWRIWSESGQRDTTEQLCCASLKRMSNVSALSWEEACLPANAAAVGDQRALSQAKVNATTGTSEERQAPSFTIHHSNLTPLEMHSKGLTNVAVLSTFEAELFRHGSYERQLSIRIQLGT